MRVKVEVTMHKLFKICPSNLLNIISGSLGGNLEGWPACQRFLFGDLMAT
jgi:hypothetical protein